MSPNTQKTTVRWDTRLFRTVPCTMCHVNTPSDDCSCVALVRMETPPGHDGRRHEKRSEHERIPSWFSFQSAGQATKESHREDSKDTDTDILIIISSSIDRNNNQSTIDLATLSTKATALISLLLLLLVQIQESTIRSSIFRLFSSNSSDVMAKVRLSVQYCGG